MTKDRRVEILVEALKQALAAGVEQRLYRSGKLDGLFASRAGLNAEAAAQAIRDGLLEVVRTETKGKAVVEWVKPTPRGVEFVHAQESPLEALRDLHAVLQASRERLPLWLGEVQGQLQALGRQLSEEAQRWTHRLESLTERVEAALVRLEGGEPNDDATPWARDVVAYLDRRKAGGAPDGCPLPELFAAVREHHDGLSVTAFHDGLRRLSDRGQLQLLPFDGDYSALPEPEYALPDGASMWYYASR
jgi:hypothetical protein